MRNFAISLIGLLAFTSYSFAADAPASNLRKAPELAFTIPGQGQRLLSQYRGKVVALEFILTTCPHCQAASHVMTRFQQAYGTHGFQALDLAINGLDDGRTPSQADQLVQAFAQEFQVGFPVGWIPRDQMLNFMQFSVAKLYVVPQLVLIDRRGYIHYETPPMGDENSLKPEVIQQRIEELLSLHAPAARHSATRKVAGKKNS